MVAVLFKAGDHEPLMPFNDVVGNTVNTAPEQIEATGLKVGVTVGLTVIINVVVAVH